MTQSSKSWPTLATLLVGFLMGVFAVLFFSYAKEAGSRKYDPRKPEGLLMARRLAYQATPLLAAVAAFRIAHGKIPSEEELMNSSLLSSAYKATCLVPASGEWVYIPEDSDSFILDKKLGWDPCLRYDSKTNVWVYDPGDGTEETPFDL